MVKEQKIATRGPRALLHLLPEETKMGLWLMAMQSDSNLANLLPKVTACIMPIIHYNHSFHKICLKLGEIWEE